MSIRLEIVLVKLELISDKQFNPFRPAIRKMPYPLRENAAIWQYPSGKGYTVCQVHKAVGQPVVHRNSPIKLLEKSRSQNNLSVGL